VTAPRVAFLIGADPPSTGGAQVHTHTLAKTLAARNAVTPEVTALWRETRTDWVAASTQPRMPADFAAWPGSRQETEVLDGVAVNTIGLAQSSLSDSLLRLGYLPMRETASRHFAAELQSPLHEPGDGVSVVHAVRLGREHLALRGLQEARALGIPFVLTPNHHPRWSRRWWPDPVWRRLYREADAVFALTQQERGLLVDLGVAESRVVVTGIGPVLAPLGHRPEILPRTAERFLLFLGQQYAYKRMDRAVEAFDRLARWDSELRLVVAGPIRPETSGVVARSVYRDRIHVLGTVSETEKRWLLDTASVLLFPSEQESFGGVVVEAATTGCPVVVAGTPAVVEVVERLSWGVIAASTTEAFASAARSLLVAPPSRRARRAAAERAHEQFSWATLAEIYETTYLRLCGVPRTSPNQVAAEAS
jgi:glycosyltransferase involved in cell wall biosynthesis